VGIRSSQIFREFCRVAYVGYCLMSSIHGHEAARSNPPASSPTSSVSSRQRVLLLEDGFRHGTNGSTPSLPHLDFLMPRGQTAARSIRGGWVALAPAPWVLRTPCRSRGQLCRYASASWYAGPDVLPSAACTWALPAGTIGGYLTRRISNQNPMRYEIEAVSDNVAVHFSWRD
jgi:hypothetical protein